MFNRSPEAAINIRNLTFVQEADEEDIVFEATEWEVGTGNLREMRSHDCYQAWALKWLDFAPNVFPAEICVTRQGVFRTARAFWIGSEFGAQFEVRRGSQVLATCPTAEEDIEVEIRCVVDIRP